MSNRLNSITAKQFRTTIKSIVLQLDSWEASQQLLITQRVASVLQAGGRAARANQARARAREALGTQELHDPPCSSCGSTRHLSDECDFLYPERSLTEEDPATKIHRSIVHRLYIKTCEFYSFLYPNFYLVPSGEVYDTEVRDPNASRQNLVFECQQFAISKAVEDLTRLNSLYNGNVSTREEFTTIIGTVYYSKVFPKTLDGFIEEITIRLTTTSFSRVD